MTYDWCQVQTSWGPCLPARRAAMWARAVAAVLLLALVQPGSAFTFRLGAPLDDCSSGSVANGLSFFALMASSKAPELAIIDSSHTYPVEYVAATAKANCSAAALVGSLTFLAQSCHFILAGSGFAMEQSLAADSLQRILIHASATTDDVFELVGSADYGSLPLLTYRRRYE